jgi:hypothetical protein
VRVPTCTPSVSITPLCDEPQELLSGLPGVAAVSWGQLSSDGGILKGGVCRREKETLRLVQAMRNGILGGEADMPFELRVLEALLSETVISRII